MSSEYRKAGSIAEGTLKRTRKIYSQPLLGILDFGQARGEI